MQTLPGGGPVNEPMEPSRMRRDPKHYKKAEEFAQADMLGRGHQFGPPDPDRYIPGAG